jgi:O-antigen/teichoic acid export membrane protein
VGTLFQHPWLRSLAAGARRIASTPRLRSELGWVIAHRSLEFVFLFALLKLLTSGLGKEGYGEYNLTEAALMFVASLLLTPVYEAYMRDYHGAAERGERRASGVLLIRWYAIGTLGTAAVLALLSERCAGWFGIGKWTALAAGLVFLGDRWRTLGYEWLNIERQRREGTLWNLAYLATQIGLIALAVTLGPATPTAALLAYACAALLFAALSTGPMVRKLLRLPPGGRSRVRLLILGFGVPFAALQLLQWMQGFSDRYLVRGLLDPASVGLYVAAYQVSGVPFVLGQRILYELITPIAYQRSRHTQDPAQLWSADRMILAGLAGLTALGVGMLSLYALFGTRLLVLLTSEDYQLPGTTIALLAAARLAQALAMSLQSFFAVHHQMGRLIWFRSVGAILTPAVCWIAIPAWGIQGAAAGTLLSFVVYLLVVVLGPGGCLWLVGDARRRARAQEPTRT